MAVTIDYQPIANGGGANVESQAQYLTDLASGGSLVNGYQAGLAQSKQVNKTLRQLSMISAAVANFIGNTLNINVVDDGNLSALITNLTNAIAAGASTLPQTGAQLQFSSITSLLLAPVTGGYLWINGTNRQIPASLTLLNTGLTASTLYYIYAFMNGATMTLEASLTGYTLASNGIPQKNGDVTRTLVGMVFVDGSSNFNDSAGKRNVASYFNRQTKQMYGVVPASSVNITFGNPLAELSSLWRVEVTSWASDNPSATAIAIASGTQGVSEALNFAIGVDGAVPATQMAAQSDIASTGQPNNLAVLLCAALTEGHHTVSPFGSSTAANSTFEAQVNGAVRN